MEDFLSPRIDSSPYPQKTSMIFIVSSLDMGHGSEKKNMCSFVCFLLGLNGHRGIEVSSQVATASVEAAKEAMKQLEEPNTVPARRIDAKLWKNHQDL